MKNTEPLGESRGDQARRAAAAVAMETTDMSFDSLPTHARFPDISVTTLGDVVEVGATDLAR